MTDPIYLDHNATTPLLPEVVDAMLPYLRDHFGNPSSGHVYGRRAREAIEAARARVASAIGAGPEEIVFTSGGTEANNLAIRGAAAARPGRRHIVTSVIEHPATSSPCWLLERGGWAVTWLLVDGTCRVRVDDVRRAVTGRTALVTLMHSNNETGSIQPVAEVSRAVRDAGALLHTDAAQSAGKVALRVDDLGVDLLSIAGHKLYAPKGVGALYVREGVALEPLMRGAGHERGLRPGTENMASIVGLGVACEIAAASLATESARVRSLRDELWSALRARIPGIGLNGHEALRLPNTLNVRFPGARGGALLERAPGIAASTGSACHEGEEAPSAVLLATGLSDDEALGSIRLSLGRATTAEDARIAAGLLADAWDRAATSGTGRS
jgi:cysteine desulfurase